MHLVWLGLVCNVAVAISVKLPIHNDTVTHAWCAIHESCRWTSELGYLLFPLCISYATIWHRGIVVKASVWGGEVIGGSGQVFRVEALAVEDYRASCQVGGGVNCWYSEILTLAKLISQILAHLSDNWKALLCRNLSVNSGLRNTALVASTSVRIKAFIRPIDITSAYDSILNPSAVALIPAATWICARAALLHSCSCVASEHGYHAVVLCVVEATLAWVFGGVASTVS